MNLRNIKSYARPLLIILGAIMATVGSSWEIDAYSRYNYPGKVFILQEYMIQTQQEMLGFIVFISGASIMFLCVSYPWPWVRKVTCVNCQESKTRNRNDEGVAICDSCEEAAWKKSLIDKVKDEEVLGCPVDGFAMHKLVLNRTEIVVDQCPECGGTWLNRNRTFELEESLR